MVTDRSPSVHLEERSGIQDMTWEPLRKARTGVSYGLWILRRDVPNRWRYGSEAPRWCQRIWIDPSDVERAVFAYGDEMSACVLGGDWDLDQRYRVESLPKIRTARCHWEDGVSWADSGLIDHHLDTIRRRGHMDGCRSPEDLARRYERVDALFETMRRERRLRLRSEVTSPVAFRELGGVRIHIGRDCEPIFGGSGHHRLAAALTLGLTEVPAMIGVVHDQAIGRWKRCFSKASNLG